MQLTLPVNEPSEAQNDRKEEEGGGFSGSLA